MLTKDYKFYLSLENSICRDYVTEKFYGIMDHAIVVPIVLERRIVTGTVRDPETASMLNKSFLAVDDFPNVAALAEYMKYLDGNLTAYMEYFEWRMNYRIVFEPIIRPGCQLCRMIKEKKERKIDDIGKWWHEDAKCHKYVPK